MIATLFEFGNELIEIRIKGNNCLFRNSQFGGQFATIDNLRIDKKGTIKEFPDLKEDPEWREKAIKRFVKKMKSFPTDREKMNYMKQDLSKFGYIPVWEQIKGRRPKKIN